MHITLYIDTVAFAGTERHMLDLALGLQSHGVDVRLACPAASPLADRAAGLGVRVVPVPGAGAGGWRSLRILCGQLPDDRSVLHAHNGRSALQAALAVRLVRRGRCVMTQHFLCPAHLSHTGVKALAFGIVHRWVNKQASGFIAVSGAVRAAMLARREAAPERVALVPNGLSCAAVDGEEAASLRREFGVPEGAPLVVCVARLEPEKGLLTLLQALAEVLTSRPDVRALVVGDGSQRRALQEAAGELGIAHAVMFTGFRDDARTAIAASDVFVLPSPAEPFGLVLIEAMALGRAVVATDAGGPREIVVDGGTGRLVAANDPQALASALAGLIARPAERQRMGQAGKRRYEACYTTRQMAERTLAVYDAALGVGTALGMGTALGADKAGRDL